MTYKRVYGESMKKKTPDFWEVVKSGKCPICKRPFTSVSMITGKVEPCGHYLFSRKQQERNKKWLVKLNKVASKISGR
jgi:hypothetical protein